VEKSFDKLRGFTNVTRAAKAKLSQRGSITMLSGASAMKPPEATSLAAAANASIVSFAKALAIELAPVRVNSLMPGPVETPLHGENLERVRAWASTLPAQHFGQPQDIAQAAILLMTNPYITGHNLVIDGGYLLQ
jgi:NAD(P)-dependent dehydrogenase (short-subunit alcohol dehydrogenase family)